VQTYCKNVKRCTMDERKAERDLPSLCERLSVVEVAERDKRLVALDKG
jgi:hypothetical protein